MRLSLTPIFWDKPEGRNIKSLKLILSIVDEIDSFNRDFILLSLMDMFKVTRNSAQALLSVIGALGVELNNLKELKQIGELFKTTTKEEFSCYILNRFKENLLGFKELIDIFKEIETDEAMEFNRILQKWIALLPREHRYKKNHKYQLISRIAWLLDLGFISRIAREDKIFYVKKREFKENTLQIPSLKSEVLSLAERQRKEIIDRVLDYLLKINPEEFELLIGMLLESLRYKIEITRHAKDGGYDIEAVYDNGLQKTKTAIQVKRYKKENKISRTVIDQLRGSLHRAKASQGMVITTSDFTKDALASAIEFGAPPISLVNGTKLVQLLAEQKLGIETLEINIWEIKEDFFMDHLVSKKTEEKDKDFSERIFDF
ncbi:MAG: restriction endonuclease [Candidatus Heimdallarchaeaceae archaeon]